MPTARRAVACWLVPPCALFLILDTTQSTRARLLSNAGPFSGDDDDKRLNSAG